jgi:hypothetical protein
MVCEAREKKKITYEKINIISRSTIDQLNGKLNESSMEWINGKLLLKIEDSLRT